MSVFVYVNTSKKVGDPDHLKVFANADAAEAWFAENDLEGVAFEYEVTDRQRKPRGLATRCRMSQPKPAAQTAPPAMNVMPAMKSIASARVSIQSPRMCASIVGLCKTTGWP